MLLIYSYSFHCLGEDGTYRASPLGQKQEAGRPAPHFRRRSTLPSLQQYILVSSDRKQVEVYSRESSGWHYEVYLERGEFKVACSGQTLTLEQIYTAVKL